MRQLTDPEAKLLLLGVAEDCDNLAVWTEEQKEPAPQQGSPDRSRAYIRSLSQIF
jgi:hypothetical protein